MGTETDSSELPWQPWQLWRTAALWEATAHLTQDLVVAAIGSSLILLVLGSLALLPLIPVGVPPLVMSLWLAAGAAGLARRRYTATLGGFIAPPLVERVNGADSWVDVKSNSWVIENNRGTNAPVDGFQTHHILDHGGDWNVFGNTPPMSARTDSAMRCAQPATTC